MKVTKHGCTYGEMMLLFTFLSFLPSISSKNDILAGMLMSFGLSPYFPGDRVHLQGKRKKVLIKHLTQLALWHTKGRMKTLKMTCHMKRKESKRPWEQQRQPGNVSLSQMVATTAPTPLSCASCPTARPSVMSVTPGEQEQDLGNSGWGLTVQAGLQRDTASTPVPLQLPPSNQKHPQKRNPWSGKQKGRLCHYQPVIT